MGDWLLRLGDMPLELLMTALGIVMLLDTVPLLGVLVPGDAAVLAAVGLGLPSGGTGALIAVVVGNVSGWSASFFAGRYFGPRLRRSRVGAWIGEARWAAAERTVDRGGGRMVLVAPFLPVLNALLPLAAGGLRMSYRRFVVFAATGAALWAGLYVFLGTVAGMLGGLEPGGPIAVVTTTAIGLAVGWVILIGLRRRLRIPTEG